MAGVVQGGHAGDHHDVAAGLLAHAWQHELAQAVGAQGVGAHDPLELGRVGLGHALAAAGDAGVVHEDVDVAEVGERRLDHGFVGLEVVDRRLVGGGPPAGGLDGAHGLLGRVGVLAVVDGDGGAVLGQGQRDGPADAPAAAGDQRHPSVEAHVESSYPC